MPPLRFRSPRGAREPIFEQWTAYLNTRLGAGEDALTKRTAENLGQRVAHLIAYLDRSKNGAGSWSKIIEQPAACIAALSGYFDAIRAERGVAAARQAESIVVGRFLPWVKREKLLDVDLNVLWLTKPLPLRNLNFPVTTLWLDETGAAGGVRAGCEVHLRKLSLFALAKIDRELTSYEHDARPIYNREDRALRRFLGLDERNGAAEPSATAILLHEPHTIDEFIAGLPSMVSTNRVKGIVSSVRRFCRWAEARGLAALDPDAVKNPLAGVNYGELKCVELFRYVLDLRNRRCKREDLRAVKQLLAGGADKEQVLTHRIKLRLPESKGLGLSGLTPFEVLLEKVIYPCTNKSSLHYLHLLGDLLFPERLNLCPPEQQERRPDGFFNLRSVKASREPQPERKSWCPAQA